MISRNALRRLIYVAVQFVLQGIAIRVAKLCKDPRASVSLAYQSWEAMEARNGYKAIWLGRLATAADPTNPDAYRMLGYAFFHEGKLQQARESYQHGINIAPYDARLHWGVGDVEMRAGEYEQAEATYREAARLVPEDGQIRLRLAAALEMCQRHAEAAFQATLGDEAPNEVLALGRLGIGLCQLGQWERAVELLTRATSLGVVSATVQYHTAFALSKLGRSEEALWSARRAAELDINYRDAQSLIAQLKAASPSPSREPL